MKLQQKNGESTLDEKKKQVMTSNTLISTEDRNHNGDWRSRIKAPPAKRRDGNETEKEESR